MSSLDLSAGFAVALVLAAFTGCSSQNRAASDTTTDDLEATNADTQRTFGAPLRGLTADQQQKFQDGLEEFTHTDSIEEGLGPVFNDSSCGACHSAGATGGASDRTVTRFGTTTDGKFDPLTSLGGSLINAQGIGQVSDGCNFAPEVVPTEATIVTKRVTTPTFGLGLVDAVPDRTFLEIANNEACTYPDTAGHAAQVNDLKSGKVRIGKFGWKAQNPSLFQFAGDAYVNEVGITNPFFPDESCPQGDCDLVKRCNPSTKHPEDDGTDVDKFTSFMSFLAPPPPTGATYQTRRGRDVFFDAGCAQCHKTTLQTGANDVAALDHVTFHPYSDFLLHDMGALGDGIAQGDASGTEIRTAPLWGVRVRPRLLHDGRATTIEDAILAHAGQGAGAANAFSGLGADDKAALIAFVKSL
jgi:CxxC motif-containing protein (DUF1111 family)